METLTPATWQPFLGQPKHYRSFLEYFTAAIAQRGYEAVVKESLFADTPEAQELLTRMFAGLYHPFISLGYGLEFRSPGIVAEALAMGAVHDDSMKAMLVGAETAALEVVSLPASASVVEC